MATKKRSGSTPHGRNHGKKDWKNGTLKRIPSVIKSMGRKHCAPKKKN